MVLPQELIYYTQHTKYHPEAMQVMPFCTVQSIKLQVTFMTKTPPVPYVKWPLAPSRSWSQEDTLVLIHGQWSTAGGWWMNTLHRACISYLGQAVGATCISWITNVPFTSIIVICAYILWQQAAELALPKRCLNCWCLLHAACGSLLIKFYKCMAIRNLT